MSTPPLKVRFQDPLFDAQLLRVLGHVYERGADVGECLSTSSLIQEVDPHSWATQWSATADRLHRLAQADLGAGHRRSAGECFLRAASYYRTAACFLIGLPADLERFKELYRKQAECFRAGIELDPTVHCEVVAIAYEGTTLPGYFLSNAGGLGRGKTVIVNGGYDSTAEECYLFSGAAALRHGYHCLLFDGPGQGSALVEQGLNSRPDWERVITPVVDYLLTRADVEPAQISLIGISLGGYLAPRAAAGEHRLAALAVDPGQLDLGDAVRAKIPLPQYYREAFPQLPYLMLQGLALLFGYLVSHSTKGWVFRRGMFVHGVSTPIEYLSVVCQYSLKDCVEKIRCPTLVCHAESDVIAGQARLMYDKLQCPKQFISFTNAEGAGGHCEAGTRSLLNTKMFNWLDEQFAGKSTADVRDQ